MEAYIIRISLSKNARKYVDDYFQWDDIMKKFDDIIAKVGKTTA